jgi:hypothetical protein
VLPTRSGYFDRGGVVEGHGIRATDTKDETAFGVLAQHKECIHIDTCTSSGKCVGIYVRWPVVIGEHVAGRIDGIGSNILEFDVVCTVAEGRRSSKVSVSSAAISDFIHDKRGYREGEDVQYNSSKRVRSVQASLLDASIRECRSCLSVHHCDCESPNTNTSRYFKYCCC